MACRFDVVGIPPPSGRRSERWPTVVLFGSDLISGQIHPFPKALAVAHARPREARHGPNSVRPKPPGGTLNWREACGFMREKDGNPVGWISLILQNARRGPPTSS